MAFQKAQLERVRFLSFLTFIYVHQKTYGK